jgi:hypothetical protein
MKTKLLIIMVICSQFVFSQKRSLRVANEQYLKSNYSSVIENYKTITATKYAMQFSDLIKLAHSYYNIGDYENAKMYYDLAFKRRTTTDRFHKLNYMHLNLVFKDTVLYKRFSKKFKISDTVLDKYISNTIERPEDTILTKVDSLMGIFNYYEDDQNLYSTIIQDGYSKNLVKNKDSLQYQELFQFKIDINQGAYSYNRNKTKVLITLNEFKGRRIIYKKGKSNLKIYELVLNDSTDTAPKQISINQKKYNFSSPVYSNDFTKLYFVSDMPGGLGATDIYVADVSKEGTFSNVKNLGPTINTSKRENFITLDAQNNLYFSSDGHLGLGGLDIFKINLDNTDNAPENLGSEINSIYDEFYYRAINNSMYFSSNSYGVDKTYVLQYTAYVQQQKNKQLLEDFKQYLKEITYASKAYAQLLESLQIEKTELSKKKIALINQVFASSKNKQDSITVANSTKPLELVVDTKEKKVEKPVQKIKIYHTILGSFLDRRRAENLKMSLLKLNLGEVQILEKTALGFHRVSIKRDRSYRKAMKELPNYVEQGYLDAWIVPYLVIK